jgi:hypothetical protein
MAINTTGIIMAGTVISTIPNGDITTITAGMGEGLAIGNM